MWVIDTGSIIQLRREAPKKAHPNVLAALDGRVSAGALVFPPEVFTELERASEGIKKKGNPDVPFAWAKKNEAKATTHGHLYHEARQILRRVPNLVDVQRVAVSGIDDADPYVIALAVKLRMDGHEVTIITDDFITKPTKTALADAAGVFGMPCVRMRTFLITENIWDGQV